MKEPLIPKITETEIMSLSQSVTAAYALCSRLTEQMNEAANGTTEKDAKTTSFEFVWDNRCYMQAVTALLNSCFDIMEAVTERI